MKSNNLFCIFAFLFCTKFLHILGLNRFLTGIKALYLHAELSCYNSKKGTTTKFNWRIKFRARCL